MGRTVQYNCDKDGQAFGNKTHLNVKGITMYISFFDVNTQYWAQKPISILKANEMHFCNAKCLAEYLSQQIKEKVAQLKERIPFIELE